MPNDRIRRTLGTERWRLLARRNVLAVGIGYKVTAGRRTDRESIVCSVRAKVPRSALAASEIIPAMIEDIPTDVVQTGPIFAWVARTGRNRPAPGGTSIGHASITAGTLGCLVRRDNVLHILSNNHVLANSNDAMPGDPILQPGPADGGRNPEDVIATLSEFVRVTFDAGGLPPIPDPSDCGIAGVTVNSLNAVAAAVGSRTRLRAVRDAARAPGAQADGNLVDAAIAEPVDPGAVTEEIYEIGRITGLAAGELGMAIKKSGRTTGLTTGSILQTDVTVRVSYGTSGVATFTDQLMAGAMSQGGDSGSSVLTSDNKLAGLLFAGSTNSTIINRIQHVFSALNLALP